MIEYIFSINTGRSGSEYLKELFACVKDASANHEPEPVMNREIMGTFLRGKSELLRANIRVKVESIQKLKGDKRLYVETSHVFIKSFGWLLPEYIPSGKMGVIILTRDKDKIARSLTRIKCNAVNNEGKGWIMHITKKDKLVPLPDNIKFPYLYYYYYRLLNRSYAYLNSVSSPLGKVISRSLFSKEPELPPKINTAFLHWYLDETNAMADKYRDQFPEIRYLTVDLNDLNNIETVESMFAHFDISDYDKNELYRKVGNIYNAR